VPRQDAGMTCSDAIELEPHRDIGSALRLPRRS
jgi:hypothetical protein